MTGDGERRDELHSREQFFFDDATVARLADLAGTFERPCCLCTPLVGAELERRGRRDVATLDTDARFAHLAGFQAYDLYRPRWIEPEFGLILCDPPFFRVSLSQLFDAIRTLAHNDFDQPIALAFLSRRASAVTGTFERFGLVPTGIRCGYRTVQPTEKNEIELFSNLEGERLALQ
ncbi:MAG: hypothetical protein AAF957_03955 [Planctomycetota bacterium]